MSKREDLEAALRARPDDAALLVYADYLQSEGDPRGELIALDLRPPSMSMQSVEVRRGQLLHTWLGDDIEITFDVEQQLWYAGELDATYATFDMGFLDLHVADEVSADVEVPRLLSSPAGAYLRRLSLRGPSALLEPLLEALAARPRAWLQHLAIARVHESSWLASPALSARLVGATPNLEVLDLLGARLLDGFAHPRIRELGLTGTESIDLVDGPPLAALHTIDFAFDGDRATPRGLFVPARVPALRHLSFTREEPADTRLFGALGTLGVAAQLTRLVLPAIRPHHHAHVQAAIDRMPMLRELVIARAYASHGLLPELRHAWARVKIPMAYPWPPREQIERWLDIDGAAVDPHELVEVLESQYDQLPEHIRAIWYRFGMALDGLRDEQAFIAQDLVTALAALELTPGLASLLDHLQARLRVRPTGFHAIMHWL